LRVLTKSKIKSKDKIQHINLNIAELYLIKSEIKETNIILDKLENEGISQPKRKDRFYYLKARIYIVQDNFKELKAYVLSILKKITSDDYKYRLKLFYLDSLRYLNESFEEEAMILLDELKAQKQKQFEGKLLNIMGVYHLHKSKYMNALKYFKMNYHIVDEENDKTSIQIALHNIGIVYSRLGDKEEAKIFYEKALKIAREIGNNSSISKITSDLASILVSEGNFDMAIQSYKEGLEIARTVGNKMQVGLILYNLGNVYHYMDEYETSIDYLMKSKAICEKISDTVGITYANDTYGDNLFRMEKIDEAKKVYLENLEIQKEINDPEGISHTYGNLGNIAKVQQNYDEAEEFYSKQQEILAEVGDKEGEGKAYFNWAMIEIEREKPLDAIPRLKKAIKLFEECSFKIGLDLAKEQLKGLVE